MTRKTPKFALGIFLIVGFLIGAAAIVWVGSSRYFEKGKLYSSFFNETVQGLQRDSVVKYLGVEIGRVAAIKLAPDRLLIEVDMRISTQEDVISMSVAQLAPIGITGLVYIDLNHRTPGEPDRSPRLNFTPAYPVIPSRPSRIKELSSSVEEIMGKLGQVDLNRLEMRVELALSTAQRVLSDPQIGRVISNLDSITANLDRVAGRIEKITAQGRLETAVNDAGTTIRDLKRPAQNGTQSGGRPEIVRERQESGANDRQC